MKAQIYEIHILMESIILPTFCMMRSFQKNIEEFKPKLDKKAKAWKTYKDYVPTKEDSLKLYGNKKRISKDALYINKDSTNYFINTK